MSATTKGLDIEGGWAVHTEKDHPDCGGGIEIYEVGPRADVHEGDVGSVAVRYRGGDSDGAESFEGAQSAPS